MGRFQLDSICQEITDESILAVLGSLPKDLPETFERILRKIAKKALTNPEVSKKIFALVAAAQRPLTLAEIREGLCVVPGVVQPDTNKLVNDMSMALSGYGSLLVLDEEDLTIQLAHHSIRHYLASSSRDIATGQYHFAVHEADPMTGEICVTYLNFALFETQLTKINNRISPQPYAITSIAAITLSQTAVSSLAR